MLDVAGIGKDRLHLAWISSAEALRFAEITTSTTLAVRGLGKFDSRTFALELSAAEMTLGSETLRWLVGKEVKLTTGGDVYGHKWETERYESVIDDILEREYHKNLIYQAVKEGCTSVRDVSKRIGIELNKVSYLLADLERTNMIEFTGMEDRKPVFAVK